MRRERRHALVPVIAELGLDRATVPFLFVQTMHPGTISFISIGVQQIGKTNFKVTGDLTIRGVTKQVTVGCELTGAENDPQGRFRVGFHEPSSQISRTCGRPSR
ncbi:YceI family protein [Streptomyces sp. NPDC000851]